MFSCIKVLNEFYEAKLDQIKNDLNDVPSKMDQMEENFDGKLNEVLLHRARNDRVVDHLRLEMDELKE